MADFGLSKNTYAKMYFRQDTTEVVKLPIKWLALESMEDAIFSEKTDVVRNGPREGVGVKAAVHGHQCACLFSVVIWSHLLGGVQWWETALPRNQSPEPTSAVGGRPEDGEAQQCCLQ